MGHSGRKNIQNMPHFILAHLPLKGNGCFLFCEKATADAALICAKCVGNSPPCEYIGDYTNFSCKNQYSYDILFIDFTYRFGACV
jgi:hypothetical protein